MMQPQPHENGIIRPIKGKRDPAIGPDAVMVMVASDLNYLVLNTKARKLTFSDAGLYSLYQPGEASLRDTAIAGPFMGAPQAVMGMEKLIALGAHRIWVLGWCGSLQPDLHVGDLIVPVRAVSEEGVSPHYPLTDGVPESDSKLNRLIEHALKAQDIHFKKGVIWTTDAIYRETPHKIQVYGAQGLLGVEMEISALLTVAAFRGAALAALLVISDEIFDLKWRPGFSSSIFKERTRLAGEVMIRALQQLPKGTSAPFSTQTGGIHGPAPYENRL
ncbi:MAG: nucleoside phosphorylase [Desulfatiglandaceae bacterium]